MWNRFSSWRGRKGGQGRVAALGGDAPSGISYGKPTYLLIDYGHGGWWATLYVDFGDSEEPVDSYINKHYPPPSEITNEQREELRQLALNWFRATLGTFKGALPNIIPQDVPAKWKD